MTKTPNSKQVIAIIINVLKILKVGAAHNNLQPNSAIIDNNK